MLKVTIIPMLELGLYLLVKDESSVEGKEDIRRMERTLPCTKAK